MLPLSQTAISWIYHGKCGTRYLPVCKMYVRSRIAIVFCSNHCFRETIRIWHLSADDRKIRPIDIKTGQIKRITRVLEVGF